MIALTQEDCKVKATGKSYKSLEALIRTVRDDKIVQFDELYDRCAVAAAHQAG